VLNLVHNKWTVGVNHQLVELHTWHGINVVKLVYAVLLEVEVAGRAGTRLLVNRRTGGVLVRQREHDRRQRD